MRHLSNYACLVYQQLCKRKNNMALTQQQFERLQSLHKQYGGPSAVPDPRQNSGGYSAFGTIGGALKEFGSGISAAFQKRTDAAANEADSAVNGTQSIPRSALRMFGQGAGMVGDAGFELLKLATPKFIEDAASVGTTAVANTEPVQAAYEKYQQFKTSNPETAKDLDAIGNILSIIPIGKSAQVLLKGTEKAVAKAPGAVNAVIGRVDSVVDDRRVANIAKEEKKINDTVGKVIQGKPQDIEQAKRALSSLDISEVKTYKDLNNVIDDKLEALKRTQDAYLDTVGGTFKPEAVKKTTKVGQEEVTQNFVQDALDQLDELYGSIKDKPEQLRVQQLRDKFQTEGLTARELNDLSRTYGTEFGKKAFGKTGEALTSTNAQAFENTRKGIKDAARGVTTGNTSKLLDSQMADLLKTRKLTKDMERKVNALWQRVSERGIAERIARGAATIIDTVTLKTVSGFLSRMLPSNVGLKTMNSIDLERELSKNLKVIEHALNSKSDGELVSKLIEAIQANQ